MFSHKTVVGFAAGTLAALVLLALVAWPVLADQREGTEHASAGRQAFDDSDSRSMVPAAAFSQDGGSSAVYDYWLRFAGGALYGSSDGPCLKAPVYLPHPAVVDGVYASVYDNDGGNNLTVSLFRVDNFTGHVDQMTSMTTSGASTSVQQLSVDPITVGTVVSYPYYSYYTTVCLGNGSTRLYSVRVYYTWYQAYLPLLWKN